MHARTHTHTRAHTHTHARTRTHTHIHNVHTVPVTEDSTAIGMPGGVLGDSGDFV